MQRVPGSRLPQEECTCIPVGRNVPPAQGVLTEFTRRIHQQRERADELVQTLRQINAAIFGQQPAQVDETQDDEIVRGPNGALEEMHAAIGAVEWALSRAENEIARLTGLG